MSDVLTAEGTELTVYTISTMGAAMSVGAGDSRVEKRICGCGRVRWEASRNATNGISRAGDARASTPSRMVRARQAQRAQFCSNFEPRQPEVARRPVLDGLEDV